MKAEQEFAKFDIICKDFGIRVVPYQRIDEHYTLVQQIDGFDLATMLYLDKMRGSNSATIPFAHFTAAICQYIYNAKNSDSEVMLSDIARPSQFVHDTSTDTT